MAGLGDQFNKANDGAKAINDELRFILDAVSSIGDKLVSSFEDAVDSAGDLNAATEIVSKTLQKGFARDLRQTVKNTESLIKLQVKAKKGLASQAELQKKRIELEDNLAQITAKREILGENLTNQQKELLDQQEKEIINQQTILSGIEKYNNRYGSLIGLGKQYLTKIVGPLNRFDLGLAVLAKVGQILKEIDSEVANIQRGFSVTKKEALGINQELAKSALSAQTLGVNLDTVTKATNDLNNALGGTANLFTADIRNGVAFAEERLGLSAEAAANLAIEAINSGKAFNQIVAENEAAFKAVKATTGVSLNFRQTLQEANQISGALRINLEQFPGGIIEAVAAAKSLGMELETIKGIQSSILDFESSIAAELEAEALIGREINLERARLAALNNDIAGLTQEIATQFGSVAEFQKLNYVQQQAFAGAVGMSSDQLADVLRKQESINSTLQSGVETQGESLTANASALSAQEALTQSLKSLDTTLKTSLSLLLGIAGVAAILAAPFTAGMSLGAVAGLAALAGGAGVGIGALVQDGIAPSSKGPFTITDSYGATAVTTKGDGVVVSPNISQGGGSEGITSSQANEMIALLKRVADKDFSINMDGRKLSNALQTSGVSYNA